MSEFVTPDIDINDPLLKDLTGETQPVEFSTKIVSDEIRAALNPEPIPSELEEPEVIDVDDEPTPTPDASHKGMAESLIETLNGISQAMLPNQYKRVYFNNSIDFARAKQVKKDAERGCTLEIEDEELLKSYDKYHDQCDLIPMSKDIKREATEPLAEILAKHGGEMTPEIRLLIVLGGWALPLALPFVTKNF